MVSGEVEVVEEVAGVTSTKANREAKIDLAMVSKTSLEVLMVINFKPIGLGLLSVSIVKNRRLIKLITGHPNANF